MTDTTIQIILQAGALGLLLLVLLGLGWLVRSAAPQVSAFLAGLVAQQAANERALVTLTEQTRAGFAYLTQRIELAESKIGAVVDRSARDVIAEVRDRASHVVDEVVDRRSASGAEPQEEPRRAAGGVRR